MFRRPELVGGWLLVTAFLLISSLPTLSWGALRPRRNVRLELLAFAALLFAALISEPWLTLAGICLVYLMFVPYGWWSYRRFRRLKSARNVERS